MNRSPTDPPANGYLSTAQVARAMGVSVTTVKRWVDDEVLPAHRTAGGHRKLLYADVLRLMREGNLPRADPGKLLPAGTVTPTGIGELLHEMTAAVADADGNAIRRVIHGGYQAGVSIAALSDQVIAPALRVLGCEWEETGGGVMKEHRVTLACVAALYELRADLRRNAERGRPVAVGGAPEHDPYILPSLLAKLTLLDAGWDAVNLGPFTPFPALSDAVNVLRPRLVWISTAVVGEPVVFAGELREFVRDAERAGVAVAIGGRGMAELAGERMTCGHVGGGMAELAAFASSLYRRPQLPRRGRPPKARPKSSEDRNAAP